MNDTLTPHERIAAAFTEARLAMLDFRIDLSQRRDAMLNHAEEIVFLDGLSEYEELHAHD